MSGNFQLSDSENAPPRSGAALVGGLAFIVFFGCVSLVLADADHAESKTWWGWFAGSACVIAACIITYRRPRGPIALTVVMVNALFGAGVLGWITVMFGRSFTDGFAELDLLGQIKAGIGIPLALAGMWAGWFAFTVSSVCYATYREPPHFIRRFKKWRQRRY